MAKAWGVAVLASSLADEAEAVPLPAQAFNAFWQYKG